MKSLVHFRKLTNGVAVTTVLLLCSGVTIMKKMIATALMTAALLGTAGAASAGPWQRNHPRRAEVNHRLANQDHRINAERGEGEISGRQAHALHAEDRSIRHEERSMASLDNGHITKADQRSLNQQENTVSRQIAH